jgi:signal transduction histidine kinase
MAIHNAVDEDSLDWPAKSAELARVANFTAFLDASNYRFNEIERLIKQGERDKATQVLSKFSHEEIDVKFQPLIDLAIDAERKKAEQAKDELERLAKQSRWIAFTAASCAAMFSLLAGILLLRSVQKPMKALMTGTNEIASGNLAYRIDLNSKDEFSYLANHFNQMAQELEYQQDKLRQGRIMLENRVTERTVDLRKANEELKRMDTARREFFADISHELRTPITVIRGEAEVALRGKIPRNADEYRESLQRIVELSSQLGTYVNDLLFMARAESTKMHFEWDKVDLNDLVNSAIDDIKVMATERSLSASLETVDRPLWIRGDKQRLRQVIFIIADNACRYSNAGGHILAELKVGNQQACFSLSDQGIGIPSQDMERIFDRHFRSTNAQHSHDDGSGLGLAMAKSIVKAHGGHIDVSSIENVGSTFSITLPLLK